MATTIKIGDSMNIFPIYVYSKLARYAFPVYHTERHDIDKDNINDKSNKKRIH